MKLGRCSRLLRREARARVLWQSMPYLERAAYATLHPDSVLVEESDFSSGDEWWDRLSHNERVQYVKEHPKSKYAHKLGPNDKPKQAPAPQRPLTTPAKKEQPKNEREATPTQSPSGALVEAPENRDHWPEHIRALKLPPAWHTVRINMDPDGDLLAIGKDQKNRDQYVYSDKFSKSQAAIKFARIHELQAKASGIKKQIKLAQASPDKVVRDHGDCTRLVMEMGIRPGSNDDTGAETKAYGASTLLGQHVVEENGETRLQFVGKKGVSLNLHVEDPDLADMLKKRAKESGSDGKLFGNVTNASLLAYVHSLDGGSFKTKDMRTLKGTSEAHALVQSLPAPKTKREYAKMVRMVAIHVSKKLGNTPSVALASYISPVVFAPWQGFEEQSEETSSQHVLVWTSLMRLVDQLPFKKEWREAKSTSSIYCLFYTLIQGVRTRVAELRIGDHAPSDYVPFQWRTDVHCGFIGNRRFSDPAEWLKNVKPMLRSLYEQYTTRMAAAKERDALDGEHWLLDNEDRVSPSTLEQTAGIGAPNHLRVWFDSNSRSWVVQVCDANDNQIGDATYLGSKSEVQPVVDQLKREHRISKVLRGRNAELSADSDNEINELNELGSCELNGDNIALSAKSNDWWTRMSAAQQRAYVKDHPRTQMHLDVQPEGAHGDLVKRLEDLRSAGAGRGKEYSRKTEALQRGTMELHFKHNHLQTAPHLKKLLPSDRKTLADIDAVINGTVGVNNGNARKTEFWRRQLLSMRKRLPTSYITPPSTPCYRTLSLKPESIQALLAGRNIKLKNFPISHWSAVPQSMNFDSKKISVIMRRELPQKDVLLNCMAMSRDFNKYDSSSLFDEVLTRGNSPELNVVQPLQIAALRMTKDMARKFGLPVGKDYTHDYVFRDGKWVLSKRIETSETASSNDISRNMI